jgi:hypothetical protein
LTVCSSVSDEKVPWTSSQYIRLFHAEPGVCMKLTIWFLCLIILFTCCTWQGVLKHGFGFWDDIFADTSLGFPDAIGVQGADGGVVPYPKPTPKACLKRVKFIANNLRRQLRKVKVIQPRRKRPAPEGKEPKELKEPKRFKYARAVEVPRDAESRPILPLVLTDRLSLVDLVSTTHFM